MLMNPPLIKKRATQTSSILLFLAPVIIFLIVILIPFFLGIWTSLTDAKLYQPYVKFIGFGNYIRLFNDESFRQSLLTTVEFGFLALLIQVPLGLGVAFLLDIPSKMQRFWRIILVVPLLVPPVVAGLMWKTMMHPTSGVLNWLLGLIGVKGFPWLSSTSTALISVVLIDTWIYMPFAALILLSGLQSVPVDLVESAEIDGANKFHLFRFLYLPWLSPYLLLVLIFRTADSLKVFDIIYQTSRGGPLNATRVLNIKAYEEAIRWSNTGRAMAIIMVLWILSFIVSNYLVAKWYKSMEGARDLD
jgi:multiple sugar transport system permease protein